MLNGLLKFGAMIIAGRWMKFRWKGILLLMASWFVVSFVHKEYISYVELSGDASYLWQASLIKLSLYIACFLLYLFLIERAMFLPPNKKTKPVTKKSILSKKSAPSAQTTVIREISEGDDGFDFLRNKRKLDSPSDKLLK